MVMKKIKSGKADRMFVIQLFESYILIHCFKRIQAQQRGGPKTGSKYDPCAL